METLNEVEPGTRLTSFEYATLTKFGLQRLEHAPQRPPAGIDAERLRPPSC